MAEEVGGKSDEMQDGGRKEAGGQAARRWAKIWGGSSSVQLSERGDQGRLWAFGGPFWGSFQGLGGQRRAAAPTGCWPHSLASGRSAQQRGRLAAAAVTTDASGGGCRPYRTKEKALGHVLVLGRASPPAVEKPSGSALEVYLVGSAVMAGTFSDPVTSARPGRAGPLYQPTTRAVHCYSVLGCCPFTDGGETLAPCALSAFLV